MTRPLNQTVGGSTLSAGTTSPGVILVQRFSGINGRPHSARTGWVPPSVISGYEHAERLRVGSHGQLRPPTPDVVGVDIHARLGLDHERLELEHHPLVVDVLVQNGRSQN